jgi:hypothetical protein
MENIKNEDIQIPDEETRKILEELAKEAAQEEKEKAEANPDKPETAKEPEPAKPEPEPEPEQKPEPEPEPKPEPGEEMTERAPQPIPAWEFRKLEKQMKRDIEKLQQSVEKVLSGNLKATDSVEKSNEAIDDKLAKFAEKNGWDLNLVKELRDTLVPEIPQIPEEVLEATKQIKLQAKKQQEEQLFNAELQDAISVLPEFKEADPAKIRAMAYSKDKGFRANGQPRSLVEIMLANKGVLVPEKKKTFESSRGGTASGDTGIDLTVEQTAEVIEKMSPKEFETYSNNLAKAYGYTVKRQDGTVVRK